MTTTELINEILQTCLIPLLGVLTAYLVAYIKKKSVELSQKTDNALYTKYIGMLTDTVTTVVTATNQVYVDSLKKSGSFDKEAQEKAFARTKEAVLALLSDEAKKYLSEASGDLDLLITQAIESTVRQEKVPTTPEKKEASEQK